MSATGDFSFTPPDSSRVAARALVLSAVCCRGLIEKDATDSGSEELRQRVVSWLDRTGVAKELEPFETALLATPLGKLDPNTAMDATWQSEGMVVLAWALHCAKLPFAHIECEPIDTANRIGFLRDHENVLLRCPRLRDCDEIEAWADTYLTLHWRLREFSLRPGPMDLTAYVSACTWGPLRLDHLEILDNDLAIDGQRIDEVEYAVYRRTVSITQERHMAFNWLLGFETLYSEATADT